MNGPAIAVTGLGKVYAGRPVLADVTFDVAAGEIVALLGPNGAGKTTVAEIVEGYRAPDTGTVRVLGTDPRRGGREHRARVGIELQGGGIDPRMTAAEVLALHGALHASPLAPGPLLERVGLAAVAGTRYRRLSGGERQRLGLALALVGRPEVVVLDEPTSGLDVEARALVRTILGELRADGLAVLLTSHDLADVERVADRLVILDRGRTLATGAPGAIATDRTAGLRIRLDRALTPEALAELAIVAGGSPRVEGDGGLRFPGDAADPPIVAAIAAWCADRSIRIVELRSGAASLEERYLEILAAAEGPR